MRVYNILFAHVCTCVCMWVCKYSMRIQSANKCVRC